MSDTDGTRVRDEIERECRRIRLDWSDFDGRDLLDFAVPRLNTIDAELREGQDRIRALEAENVRLKDELTSRFSFEETQEAIEANRHAKPPSPKKANGRSSE